VRKVARDPIGPFVDAATATDPLRAVLFDAAGTLFRLRAPVGDVYAEVALAHGVRPIPDLAQRIEQGFRTQFPAMPRPEYWQGDPAYNASADLYWWRHLVQRVMRGLGPLDFDSFFEVVYQRYASAEAWELYPEVPEVLHELRRRGLRLGIVSNFDVRLLPVCEGLGLRHRVDAIIYAAAAAAAKPDAGIFALALSRLDVRGAAALHVGDSLEEDVLGARAAGLRSIWVLREDAGRPEVPPDIAMIHDLSALIR